MFFLFVGRVLVVGEAVLTRKRMQLGSCWGSSYVIVVMLCSRGGGTHPQKNAAGAECSPAGGHRGWLQVHPVLEQAVQRAVQQ